MPLSYGLSHIFHRCGDYFLFRFNFVCVPYVCLHSSVCGYTCTGMCKWERERDWLQPLSIILCFILLRQGLTTKSGASNFSWSVSSRHPSESDRPGPSKVAPCSAFVLALRIEAQVLMFAPRLCPPRHPHSPKIMFYR